MCVGGSVLALPLGQRLLWALSERSATQPQIRERAKGGQPHCTPLPRAHATDAQKNDELNEQLEINGTEAKGVALGPAAL